MSVDMYVEQVITHARCVVVRLLGGLDYWQYGAQEIAAVCRARRIPLAIVPGEARDDARLGELCTAPAVPVAMLEAYLRHGGPANLTQALRLAAHLGGVGAPPTEPPAELPAAGVFPFPSQENLGARGALGQAVIVFYRSHLLAGDVAPIEALALALRQRDMAVQAIYAASLKDPAAAAFVVDRLREWRPAVVLNATAFSATQKGAGSPLDAAGAPVLQVVLGGARRDAWAASTRGLSQADLAMHVVLPEIDGRLLTTAASFKTEAEAVPGLDFTRVVNCPDPDGITLAADRAQTHIVSLSPLGLVEMTRKRTRESLEHLLCKACPACEGRGFVKTPETVAHDVFREIMRQSRQFASRELLILAHQEVVDHLLENESVSLAELEHQVGRPIRMQVEALYGVDQFDVVLI